MSKAAWIIRRLREPSTWAGITGLLLALNVPAALVPFLGYGLDVAVHFLPAATATAAVVMSDFPGND